MKMAGCQESYMLNELATYKSFIRIELNKSYILYNR